MEDHDLVQFDAWKDRFHEAQDASDVLNVARHYLAAWRHNQLAQLPWDLAAQALPDVDALMARAVMASREVLHAPPDHHSWQLLEQMSLTLAYAANRIRALSAPEARDIPTVLGAGATKCPIRLWGPQANLEARRIICIM